MKFERSYSNSTDNLTLLKKVIPRFPKIVFVVCEVLKEKFSLIAFQVKTHKDDKGKLLSNIPETMQLHLCPVSKLTLVPKSIPIHLPLSRRIFG